LLAVTVRLGLQRGGDPEVGALVIAGGGFVVTLAAAAVAGDLDDLSFDDLWAFVVMGLLVPGLSSILFVHAIRGAGSARAAIVVGTAPLISALLAIMLLDEPLRASLVAGTVLVVAGGIALAGERLRPADFRAFGALLALVCAVLFGIRDNVVRWATGDGEAPLFAATAATLLAATAFVLVYVLVARRTDLARQLRIATPAFAGSGVALGLAYLAVIIALDRGRVTVVAPLNATQSLWAVVLAALIIGHLEMIGRRTVLAGVLVVAGAALVSATR
jgi:drug/metabolite transporter (DMT)-like permease